MAEISRNGANVFLSASSISAAGPDAELVECCRDFAAEVARQAGLWRGAVTIEAEEVVEHQIDVAATAHGAALDRLCQLPARTMEGLRAKAGALAAAEPAFLDGQLEGSEVGGRILASLLRDLLG